ncbi:hypothetical protein JOE44_004518 [Chryseobacterium sp. PvR013]|uniref:hypothetical protein n=1 Tax=Chryseobacterium sp. PvR013 TaxID=2806595 RepID=UPI001AE766C6|nr:hypothetical protein [Chryseobacterium sp. PvR013]MBP1167634.1 hypothetical protein [Chryseobacterium sp. PvR013]
MSDYNQEFIYQKFGQYDQVVTIYLRYNSPEFQKYGKSLVGVIRYKKDERELLQKSLDENIPLSIAFTHLKIDDNVSDISTELKYDLFYEGVDLNSIEGIYSIPYNLTNEYAKKDLRTLPNPIEIKFDASNFDAPKMYIGFYNSIIKDGFLLTIFEKKQLIAYEIIANNYILPTKIALNEYCDDVRYYVLEYKYLYESLTEDEDNEFRKILEVKIKESVDILMQNLKDESGGNLSFLNGRTDLFTILSKLATYFKPERLTFTKIPIWWNLERYLHIILGHVSEFQFNINTKTNTSFQYHLKDIKDVIKDIIESLIEEINLHFENYPGKDFKRQGGMSYYYKGDYYVIHIRHDGLLMTLYKNN